MVCTLATARAEKRRNRGLTSEPERSYVVISIADKVDCCTCGHARFEFEVRHVVPDLDRGLLSSIFVEGIFGAIECVTFYAEGMAIFFLFVTRAVGRRGVVGRSPPRNDVPAAVVAHVELDVRPSRWAERLIGQ